MTKPTAQKPTVQVKQANASAPKKPQPVSTAADIIRKKYSSKRSDGK